MDLIAAGITWYLNKPSNPYLMNRMNRIQLWCHLCRFQFSRLSAKKLSWRMAENYFRWPIHFVMQWNSNVHKCARFWELMQRWWVFDQLNRSAPACDHLDSVEHQYTWYWWSVACVRVHQIEYLKLFSKLLEICSGRRCSERRRFGQCCLKQRCSGRWRVVDWLAELLAVVRYTFPDQYHEQRLLLRRTKL